MKRLLLIVGLIIGLDVSGQSFSDYEQYQRNNSVIEPYINPKHKDFCMYHNSAFNVTSYSTVDIPVELLFTYHDRVVRTEGGPMFTMYPTYYKLYIPQDTLMFVVKSEDDRQDILNSHLRLFLKVLEVNRQRKLKPQTLQMQ